MMRRMLADLLMLTCLIALSSCERIAQASTEASYEMDAVLGG